jgi:short-subunit dehydrogenase
MPSSNVSRPQALVTGASRRRDRLEAVAQRLLQESGARSEILAADLADGGNARGRRGAGAAR